MQVADDAGEAAAADFDPHVGVAAEQQRLAGLGKMTGDGDAVAHALVGEVEVQPDHARRIVEGRVGIAPGEFGHRAVAVDPIAAEKTGILDGVEHGDLVECLSGLRPALA